MASDGNPQEAVGISWKPKVRDYNWVGLWEQDNQKKVPPHPRRWRGTVDQRDRVRGYSRDGEQVWLPQGSDKRVGISRCSGDG